MNKAIYFDPSDWNTVRDTIDKVNEIGCPQLGTNEDGEDVLFDVCVDDDGYDVLHTTTFQKNKWERHNYYYPNDYRIEELYHKEHSNG